MSLFSILAVEYTDSISSEGKDSTNILDIAQNNLMVRFQ